MLFLNGNANLQNNKTQPSLIYEKCCSFLKRISLKLRASGRIKMKNLMFLFLLIVPISFSQIQPSVNDFLISGNDNIPSTFLQNLPELFITNSNNFLTTWIDYREGEPVVYAQRFDANGNFIGNNISTGSNAGAYLNEDGYILALSTRSQPFFDDTYIFVKATLLDNSNQVVFEEEIYSTLIPWCGTGYIDGDVIVKASDNGFYFITNEGGYVALVKIESAGNYHPINLQFDDIRFVTQITSSATSNGNYFFAWINGLQEDTLETGLYATFINSQDSIIVSRLPIAVLMDSAAMWGNYVSNYNLQSIALNDSTYKLFWLNNETSMLYSVYLSTEGEIISEIDSMLVPVTPGYGYNLKVTITNLNDDSFYLFISHDNENYNSYSHTFLKYNSEGEFLGYVTGETESLFARGLFNAGQDKFFRTSSDMKDVFLDKLEYFTILESKKINDDESGSNQINNRLTRYDHNSVFSVWQDENNYYGTWIDKNGNVSGEKVLLDYPTIKFFPDKESVAYWIKENENSDVTAGYTIYDQDFNEILSKTLFTTSPYNINIHLQIISDSTFIILSDTENNLVLLKESKSGITLNERTLSTEQYITEKLFPVELNLPVKSFWVYWNKKLQHFSDDLTPLNEVIELPVTIDYYLGDDRFLNLEYKNDYLYINRFIYGTIINTSLDTVKTNIRLTSGLKGDNTFIINRIDNNDFFSVYDNTEKYYARAFSNNGTVLTDSFLVNSGSTSFTSKLSFIVNDGKVFFSWSDARNEGKGYDIYGNIFDLSSITSVKQISSEIPESFYLYQNYPNPFNPTTRIVFSVKENSLVEIKIYDILGNEVATLVNEEKSSGRYEVEFNANGLASGFYFYRINAGGFTQTRKMVLLK